MKKDFTIEKKNILVIDDDISIRTLLELFLRKEYQVVTKKNGMEAMMWMEDGNIPDLIISDVNMPRLNGLELLKNLKKSGFFRDVPVLMLSGNDNDKDSERAKFIEQGAYDYLVKPFNPTELLSKIDFVFNLTKDSSHVTIKQPSA